ncbi:MAG: pantoate--beta-alanine ligase [Chloroflexi bacterium]|nr:pantoate--beta-alanine ligase [Chloroflexota bacterium]
MRVITTHSELQTARRSVAGSVGVVMTMGALHDGHLALVRAARAEHATVIATIFVNPTQFGANEDLSRYPRTFEADRAMLEAEGVDILFAPTGDVVYPAGFQTTVKVGEIASMYEGAARPTHFDGVATVVLKLLNMTRPDMAYFGQKDAQQVAIIRRMVHDLNVPVSIAVIPTAREDDGLARSSRNRFLSADERRIAPALHRALLNAAAAYDSGTREIEALCSAARGVLHAAGIASIDYVDIVAPATFAPVAGAADGPVLVVSAIRVGSVRLLDNLLLPESLNTRAGLTANLGAISDESPELC